MGVEGSKHTRLDIFQRAHFVMPVAILQKG